MMWSTKYLRITNHIQPRYKYQRTVQEAAVKMGASWAPTQVAVENWRWKIGEQETPRKNSLLQC